MTQVQKLLTAREACTLLAVSPNTLLRLVQAGEISRIKIRKSSRYSEANIAAYIERCTVTAGR